MHQRMHHTCLDTDADPHDVRRWFFFSHIGWLHKHPEAARKVTTIDCSDLRRDIFVVFQRKYDRLFLWKSKLNDYILLILLNIVFHSYLLFLDSTYMYHMSLCFIISTLVSWWAWNESLWYAWHIVFRVCLILNFTWSINSVTHVWGIRLYNKYVFILFLIYLSQICYCTE